MPKRPSDTPPPTPGPSSPIPPGPITPSKLAAMVGFAPSDRQLEVRAAFWAYVRENPGLDVPKLTARKIADLLPCDCAGLHGWWADPAFRKWFLDGEEWRSKTELLLTLILEGLVSEIRHGNMSGRDLGALLPKVAELGRKMPVRAAPGAAGAESPELAAGKTPEELQATLERWALDNGWAPPAGWSPVKVAAAPSAEPEPDVEEA